MRAWSCELPISPISINIVLISQIFVNVHFFIGGFDTLLPQSQSMPNGSREVQQRMPEPGAGSTSYRIYEIKAHHAGSKQERAPDKSQGSTRFVLLIVDAGCGEPGAGENPSLVRARIGNLS